jgi:hypothetical protein
VSRVLKVVQEFALMVDRSHKKFRKANFDKEAEQVMFATVTGGQKKEWHNSI